MGVADIEQFTPVALSFRPDHFTDITVKHQARPANQFFASVPRNLFQGAIHHQDDCHPVKSTPPRRSWY